MVFHRHHTDLWRALWAGCQKVMNRRVSLDFMHKGFALTVTYLLFGMASVAASVVCTSTAISFARI